MLVRDRPRGRALTIPGARTKNGKPHEVPIGRQAVEILRSQPRVEGKATLFGLTKNGFSGWSKCKERLDQRIRGMAEWRLHDLRRTCATGMANDCGAQPHIVEAVLNHLSGSKNGVAGIYNRASYRKEKRDALRMWGERVEFLTSGPDTDATPLRTRVQTAS